MCINIYFNCDALRKHHQILSKICIEWHSRVDFWIVHPLLEPCFDQSGTGFKASAASNSECIYLIISADTKTSIQWIDAWEQIWAFIVTTVYLHDLLVSMFWRHILPICKRCEVFKQMFNLISNVCLQVWNNVMLEFKLSWVDIMKYSETNLPAWGRTPLCDQTWGKSSPGYREQTPTACTPFQSLGRVWFLEPVLFQQFLLCKGKRCY